MSRIASAAALLLLLLPFSFAAEMPGLPEHRQEMYAAFKMEFLPDGYPGRMTDKGLVAHPIYGAYVLGDYLRLFERSGDTKYLAAAVKVGDATIARMTEIEGGLAFLYTPEMRLSSLPGTFYSALTQARYLPMFTKLAHLSGNAKYSEAAERVLESLFIPVEDGGVMRRTRHGLVIEEWPHQMMGDYTLNGWTTAMLLVDDYAEATGSERARQLFDENLIALRSLLPLFDAPEVANTRYRLSGKTWARVNFKDTVGILAYGAVVVPGEGEFPFETGQTNRWHNFVRDDSTSSRINFNANLNYVSFPQENSIHLEIDAQGPGEAVIELYVGDYTPTGGLANRRWITLAELPITKGRNSIEASIPWTEARHIAQPTNFQKEIGGKNYNVYHFIHFENLAKLGKRTGDSTLTEFSEKWASYVDKWPTMDLYRESNAELLRYRASKR